LKAVNLTKNIALWSSSIDQRPAKAKSYAVVVFVGDSLSWINETPQFQDFPARTDVYTQGWIVYKSRLFESPENSNWRYLWKISTWRT
jgi:hypothetical protein